MDGARRADPGPAPAPAPVPVPRAVHRGGRIAATLVLGAAGLAVVAAMAAVAGLAWAVGSEPGSAWLLGKVPGLTVEAPRGSLLGDFSAQRATLALRDGRDRVTLGGLAWRGLRVERAASPRWFKVTVDTLAVARADVALAPSTSAGPLEAPTDLAWPFELDVGDVRIGEVHANALGATPVRDLAARIHLGAGNGAEHRVDRLTLQWDSLRLSGDARIASAAPMTLHAALGLAQDAAASWPGWRASATLDGPLAAPVLLATLRAEASGPAGAERPAQALDARATLRPFAAWPLGELQASTQALDLSAFAGGAPVTALSGRAVATSTAADQPASVSISLANALAGRWDEARLPVRSVALDLAARPDQPSELTLKRLVAELGTARVGAGRLEGRGRWSPQGWTLEATLAALQPAALDARAPSMRLAGPVTLVGGRDASAGTSVDIKTRLAGSLVDRGTNRNVQLELDATLQAQHLELRGLQAASGNARASLAGSALQAAAGAPWAVKAQAALTEFDPAAWWPGRADSPWRRGTHRLNATGRADLAVPADAATRTLPALLAALRGSARLAFDRSVLAGVPASGEATLRSGDGGLADAALRVDAGGNALRATGRIATTGNGSADAWNVSVDGPALARLEPVYRLFVAAGTEGALAGALRATAQVNGRWPALATQGTLDASGLRLGTFAAQQAQARWTLGTALASPLDAQLTLTRAGIDSGAAPGPSLETLQARLTGTGRAHALDLRAESVARPPAWAGTVQGTAAGSTTARTVAVVQAQGGLVTSAANALNGWHGTVQRAELRTSAGGASAVALTSAPAPASTSASSSAAAPLFAARDLVLDARWAGEAGAPPRIDVQPGRAEILGGALRWSRLAWQGASAAGGRAQVEVEATLEPLRIAPILARLQPDFGWGGDLTLGGRVSIRSAPSFMADVVVERAAGDLTVTDEIGTRALGLTDLRLGLNAANGTWSFTQGGAGKALGVVGGAEVIRTSPQATWPPADAPLEGVLELRVDDLGTWGNWVPPGWRLGGALHTTASFGGRFGAPEYTGTVTGTQLSVRNFLEGVSVVDGDVAVRLQGTTARIERFTAKAGGGTLRIDGDAALGAAPKATLKVVAERFQLLGRVDRRIVASGTGALQLDAKRLAFNGRFDVDEGLVDFSRSDAPALSSDVVVTRAAGVPSPAAAASAAASPQAATSVSINPPREVALDLRVGLGERLRIRGRGLDAGLRGELRLTSPGGKLAVDGTVRAVDGTYAAYGQKLAIDRGLIAFSGAVENPRLDIEATRPNLDIRVGVAISGTPANPRVRLFSEPELSEIDKLSWLVMGRASDGLGRTDTALLQRAALALLAGEGGGPADQVTRALGLDDISVRQTDGEVRSTVIALGKQLSKRWYVGYERGLNATAGSFQLVYRIAQRFTLRAQSGDENSLDLIWTWRWR